MKCNTGALGGSLRDKKDLLLRQWVQAYSFYLLCLCQ